MHRKGTLAFTALVVFLLLTGIMSDSMAAEKDKKASGMTFEEFGDHIEGMANELTEVLDKTILPFPHFRPEVEERLVQMVLEDNARNGLILSELNAALVVGYKTGCYTYMIQPLLYEKKQIRYEEYVQSAPNGIPPVPKELLEQAYGKLPYVHTFPPSFKPLPGNLESTLVAEFQRMYAEAGQSVTPVRAAITAGMVIGYGSYIRRVETELDGREFSTREEYLEYLRSASQPDFPDPGCNDGDFCVGYADQDYVEMYYTRMMDKLILVIDATSLPELHFAPELEAQLLSVTIELNAGSYDAVHLSEQQAAFFMGAFIGLGAAREIISSDMKRPPPFEEFCRNVPPGASPLPGELIMQVSTALPSLLALYPYMTEDTDATIETKLVDAFVEKYREAGIEVTRPRAAVSAGMIAGYSAVYLPIWDEAVKTELTPE